MNEVIWGNTVLSYLIAIGAIFVCWIVIRILKRIVLKKVRSLTSKTENRYDDIIFSVIESFILPYIYIAVNYAIISQLNLHPKLSKVLHVAMVFVSVYFFIRLINHVMQLSINGIMKRRNESEDRIRQLNGVLNIVKAVIWLMGIVFLLDNLGYNVKTVLAGLGVGGIAIALAAQTILGDLFSYFTIFFDRPFELGDFIIVGDDLGSIEHIGIKTTRIRSLSGEQLVMSNSFLTSTTIHNYKRMLQRRVVFQISVTYQTEKAQLLKIPGLLKSIVEAQDAIRFDRSHLANFGEFSINFEVVYIKLSADYNEYMDTQQKILYTIYEEFEKRKIAFAIPSRTVFVENPYGRKQEDKEVSPQIQG